MKIFSLFKNIIKLPHVQKQLGFAPLSEVEVKQITFKRESSKTPELDGIPI